MRQAAKEYLWYAANSNNQYGLLDVSQIGDQTLEIAQAVSENQKVGVDDNFGTLNVVYEVIGGELPEGLTLNALTGATHPPQDICLFST